MVQRVSRKRRFPRIQIVAPVLVKRLGEETTGEMTRVKDLGLGGCMFESNRPWGVGSELALLITLASGTVHSQARVVYELDQNERGVAVGVEFLHVDPYDRPFLEAAVPAPPTGQF
jgi:hypothetical protein